MSRLVQVELPPAVFPLPTILPEVNDGSYDFSSLMSPALNEST
jgi:hypothetical protein